MNRILSAEFCTSGETFLMTDGKAKFHIGQIVQHVLFDYRGAIFDVDQQFAQTDAWYDTMARSRPPRDKPWYQVLVDGASHTTYVAERNLEPDDSGRPIDHPLVQELFAQFEDGRYIAPRSYN
jgi:heat shock protein HspQ